MRLSLLRTDVVKIVRQDEWESNLRRELEELLVQSLLLWEAVILYLKVEAILAEDVAVTPRKCTRMLPVINLKGTRDLTVQAAGESDQPLGILREVVKVDARLVVHAVKVRIGDQSAEIAIAGCVRGEQDQVEGLLVCLPLFVGHAAACNIRLHADDRLDPTLGRRLDKLHRPVEGTVIGNGDGVHAERLRLVHERIDLAHAVEQAELGVDVEMGEVGLLAHGGSLPSA